MPKTAPRDNPCHCINVRRAANALTKFYDRAFAPIGLTTNQFSLLNDIRLLGCCNKSGLAGYSRLDRTTVIRSLKILREKGLIEDATEAGSRSKGVRLTEAGRLALAEGMDGWKQAQGRIESLLGSGKIEALKEILTDIETLNENENI